MSAPLGLSFRRWTPSLCPCRPRAAREGCTRTLRCGLECHTCMGACVEKHRVRNGKRVGWSRKPMLQGPHPAFSVAKKLNLSRLENRTYFTESLARYITNTWHVGLPLYSCLERMNVRGRPVSPHTPPATPHQVFFLSISPCAQFPRYFGDQCGPSMWLCSPSPLVRPPSSHHSSPFRSIADGRLICKQGREAVPCPTGRFP